MGTSCSSNPYDQSHIATPAPEAKPGANCNCSRPHIDAVSLAGSKKGLEGKI